MEVMSLRKALIIVLLTSLVFLSVGCEKNTTDTKQNAAVENVDKKEDSDKEESKKNQTDNSLQKSEEKMQILKIYYVDENAEIVSEELSTEDTDNILIWNQLIEKGILTANCKLNSCIINEDNKTIDLDVNTEFGEWIRSMGTTGKDEILTCVVNSYLDTYKCDQLKLTENGQALDTGDTELDGYMNRY